MLKILEVSDLHLEFGQFTIPEVENEQDIVVVLAGDIGIAKKPITYNRFIENTCDRFKDIIWIFGNHEFYNGNMPGALDKVWNNTLDYENLYVVENETVIIDNVAFICSTLWTGFDNSNIMTMQEAGLLMNDYHCIRTGPDSEPWQRKLKPIDTVGLHLRAKEYIFSEIVKQKAEGKEVVVVTHHLPSFLSIMPERKNDSLNGAYASELFEEIITTQPDIWFHGHTHDSFDYMIGKTRVICNPRGYSPDNLNPGFNPALIVEI